MSATPAAVTPGAPDRRPTIVVVDWNVTATSPIGSSILAFLDPLKDRFRFVVVAAYFENPDPERIEHERVWLQPGPSFVKELVWPTLVSLALRRRRLDRGPNVVVKATQGQRPGADIACAHFCHAAYLREHFRRSGTRGLRVVSRYLVHRYSAHLEAKAFRKASVVTVVSRGLWEELARYYPAAAEKLVLVPNPVDTASFARPPDFDRAGARAALGVDEEDVVFAFVALGDFARKGLHIAIGALARLRPPQAHILVIGGTRGECATFRGVAARAGVEQRVHFVGLQRDVRPYLWAADAYVFPTAYETFSKATYQAAAAGLPVVGTRAHGLEELIEHGVNGWLADRTVDSFADAFATVLARRWELPAMGARARESAAPYDVALYPARWQRIFGAAAERAGAPPQTDAARSLA